jgi:antitoxin component YwqK of YwqJK toxin-antitoxin module
MKKILFFLPVFLFFVACNTDDAPDKSVSGENKLIVRNGNEYTEYYPGKKQVKMHGFYNEQEQRQGKWEYFAENGIKLSLTMYENGTKEGYSVVFYPNGSQRYVGEYHNDQKKGLWQFYDENGKQVESRTFE